MDKYCNVEDRIGIQVINLKAVVFEDTTKEVESGKTKSAIEERGEDHNLTGVWSGELLAGRRTPADDFFGRKNSVLHHFPQGRLFYI